MELLVWVQPALQVEGGKGRGAAARRGLLSCQASLEKVRGTQDRRGVSRGGEPNVVEASRRRGACWLCSWRSTA